MPETTIHPQVSLLMLIVPLIVECFDIQFVKAKEISKTFPDRRGSVKWAENVRDELYKKKIKMPSREEELIVFIVDA